MQNILKFPEHIGEIVVSLDTSNSKIKLKSIRLITGICCFSEESHSMVLDSMNYFKQATGEKIRFQKLVKSLRTEESLDYKTQCLTFINALVNLPTSLSQRIALRAEFMELGLLDLISSLKNIEEEEELQNQIEVFMNLMEEDEEELKNFEIMNDPSQLAESIKKKLHGRPSFEIYLHTMQNMNELNPKSDEGELRIWQSIEGSTQKIFENKEKIENGEQIVEKKGSKKNEDDVEKALKVKESELKQKYDKELELLKLENEKEKNAIRKQYESADEKKREQHLDQIMAFQSRRDVSDEPVKDESKKSNKKENVHVEVSDESMLKQLALDVVNEHKKTKLTLNQLLHSQKSNSTKIFGSSLCNVKGSDQSWLANLITTIYTSPDHEGLFKINAQIEEINELKEKIEKGKTEFDDIANVHILAGVLKLYI